MKLKGVQQLSNRAFPNPSLTGHMSWSCSVPEQENRAGLGRFQYSSAALAQELTGPGQLGLGCSLDPVSVTPLETSLAVPAPFASQDLQVDKQGGKHGSHAMELELAAQGWSRHRGGIARDTAPTASPEPAVPAAEPGLGSAALRAISELLSPAQSSQESASALVPTRLSTSGV